MRKYKHTSIIPQQPINERLVDRSRQHAVNIFIARLLIALLLAGALGAIVFTINVAIASKVVIPLLAMAIAYSIDSYSKALEKFTIEEREILWEQNFKSTPELAIPKSETAASHDTTIIPQAKGNGHYNLHVGLTPTQLQHIAQTMLDTKTLTVNYIESLGLSRANAERMRAELAEFGILNFNDKGRVQLTDNGRKICKRITRQ